MSSSGGATVPGDLRKEQLFDMFLPVTSSFLLLLVRHLLLLVRHLLLIASCYY